MFPPSMLTSGSVAVLVENSVVVDTFQKTLVLVKNEVVETLVNTPVDAVAAPIAVLSIFPPSIFTKGNVAVLVENSVVVETFVNTALEAVAEPIAAASIVPPFISTVETVPRFVHVPVTVTPLFSVQDVVLVTNVAEVVAPITVFPMVETLPRVAELVTTNAPPTVALPAVETEESDVRPAVVITRKSFVPRVAFCEIL